MANERKTAEEVLAETNKHNTSVKYQNDTVTVAHAIEAMKAYESQSHFTDAEIDVMFPLIDYKKEQVSPELNYNQKNKRIEAKALRDRMKEGGV